MHSVIDRNVQLCYNARMTTITNQKILELALNSSDPLIKETVDKLIFALKMKYSEDDLINILDNYAYHHSINIQMPCMYAENAISPEVHTIAVSWKRERFRILSLEHQIIEGTTGDLVCGEEAAQVYLPYDPMLSMRDDK